MSEQEVLRRLVAALESGEKALPEVKASIEAAKKVLKVETPKAPAGAVLVRGDRSGVFVGELVGTASREVTLNNCRRLWFWAGAASVSQIAQTGVSKPKDCKFTVAVSKAKILDAIEILTMTDEAWASVQSVKPWTA